MSDAQPLQLKPYQREGVEFMLSRYGTLLADEQGLGKTVQVVSLINEMMPRDTLIVCPAVVKCNWRNELNKWLTCSWLDVGIAEGKSPLPMSRIVIINYDILDRKRDELLGFTWGLVVFDESQMLSNPKAKRTKVASKIKADKKVCLSGTPIPNRPVELWSVLKMLDPTRWHNFVEYAKRYCSAFYENVCGEYVLNTKGASNQAELSDILRDTVMLRREQEEVLSLPSMERHIIMATPDEDTQAVLSDLKRGRDLNGVSFRGDVDESTALATLRREVGLRKAKFFYTDVVSLHDGDPVLVFAYHKEVVDYLVTELTKEGFKVGKIVGAMSATKKADVANQFQNGELDYVVANIASANAGLTLTRAHVALFIEQDWTASRIFQAEMRIYRIGQDKDVDIYYFMFEGDVDSLVVQTAMRKEGKVSCIYRNQDTS